MPIPAPNPAPVLIVDDDDDMVMMLGEFVAASGFKSIGVQDFDGFVAAMAAAPCVLMLDLVMPDTCSERIIQWLALNAPSLPIVMVSSLAIEDIERRRVQALALGLSAPSVLRKPFWPRDVAAILSRQLADSAATPTV